MYNKRIQIILVFLMTISLLAGCEENKTSDCTYDNNLTEVADSYISRCRRAKIRSEFPGQYYNLTLDEIKGDRSGDGKKAYKLLNDNRFIK
jgi:hypothetical protein